VKRRKSLRRNKRTVNGGGYSDFLPTNSTRTSAPFDQIAVSAGNQIHFKYAGLGTDCTGNNFSQRPGFIPAYTAKGLPGMGGGAWGKKNKKNKKRGGSSCGAPGPVPNPNLPPVSGSVTPKPGYFPDTTGVGGTVANPDNKPVVMSMPGGVVPAGATVPKVGGRRNRRTRRRGGRYGMFPDMGPLNPNNGVGTTPGPFGRIPCEVGTYNPLNPNPNDIQRLSTAPLTPPFVTRPFSGGASVPAGSGLAASSANFPTVQVGDVNSMRYYAPTAGYRNDFMTFPAPSAVPGLTIQTPYDAKAFNQACIRTGGSRKNKKKGGAGPVAFDAGAFSPVTLSEIDTRKDFDGTNKGLPVKFGGKRSVKRSKKSKKSKKSKRSKKSKKNKTH
jgi:hypothetical protein